MAPRIRQDALSLNGAAIELGISNPTIRRYIERGFIRIVPRGSGVVITRIELERFRERGNHPDPEEVIKANFAARSAIRSGKVILDRLKAQEQAMLEREVSQTEEFKSLVNAPSGLAQTPKEAVPESESEPEPEPSPPEPEPPPKPPAKKKAPASPSGNYKVGRPLDDDIDAAIPQDRE